MVRRLAFSLVPLVVLLGAAEAALRAIGWPPKPDNFEHQHLFWLTQGGLVDSPFDHKEHNRQFGVSTDANGMRAPLHEQRKPPGTWRIATMGCSTTFGWGVEDHETWPARLERLAWLAGHDTVQVINAGQPGYTTLQGMWLWENLLRTYQPDVVVIAYLIQDARDVAYTDRSQAILSGENFVLKRELFWKSRTYIALRAVLGDVQIRAKERKPGEPGAVNRVPVGEFVENLSTLATWVRASGATPVFLAFPLQRSGYTSEHRTAMVRLGRRLSVPILNPQDLMDKLARESTLYFPNDPGHANARGLSIIGQWVYEFLEQSNLLGSR